MRMRYLNLSLVVLLVVFSTALSCNDGGADDDDVTAASPPVETPTPALPTASPTIAPTHTPAATPSYDLDEDGYTLEAGDCNDEDATVYPGADEVPYDGIDQDCDGADLTDVDEDGWDAEVPAGPDEGPFDCDDGDPTTYPGAEEVGDGIDNDCDGEVDEGVDTVDNDGDGYSEMDGDCDDEDSDIYPDAEETPYDGVDQDCDGEDLNDVDGDGANGGEAGTDCDDEEPTTYPGADEVPYDGIDQDCDGADLNDVDQDGVPGGSGGPDEGPFDCDDEDPGRYPGLEEVPYDGIDQDCDGVDPVDLDEDGVDAEEAGGDDCDDEASSIYPGAQETPYDGIDQNCDGEDLVDVDGDGYDAEHVGGDDCDDEDINTHPGADEFADGKDNDCDGETDEDLSSTDDDQDGWSDADGDCNDYDASVHPEAEEVPYDGIDQDCSGQDLVDVDGDGSAGGDEADDCDDEDPTSYPGANEVPYDGIDQNCNGEDLIDVDRDGYAPIEGAGPDEGPFDCDDEDPLSHPGGSETPYDGIDQDCSGADLTDVDEDGFDGSAVDGPDCNDADPAINPDADEVCDGQPATQDEPEVPGIDNNCDGIVDEDAVDRNTYYTDGDHDGYGNLEQPVLACYPSESILEDDTDCDDTHAVNYPGAEEVCDEMDNDCDGATDEEVQSIFYLDADTDGYGDPDGVVLACAQPEGTVMDNTDCDDGSSAISPAGTESCNGIDDDCDGEVDEGVRLTFFMDSDRDGFGDPESAVEACQAPPGHVADNTDCRDTNDSIYPGAPEICNEVDDDCDGEVDEGVQSTFHPDADSDGYGSDSLEIQACTAPPGYVVNAIDCDDWNGDTYPGSLETCDGKDNDCDTQIDDGVQSTFYLDADGDGFGVATSTTLACELPSGYALNTLDCDDSAASVNPDASETLNGVDDNCDGQVDEGLIYRNCKQLLEINPGASSGVYTIDPDDSGSIASFDVHCDMDNHGGGWTLAMKVDGQQSTFYFGSSYWTNTDTYNTGQPNFDNYEAKLESYNTVPFDSVMIGMKDGGVVRYLTFNHSASSLYSVISQDTYISTSLGREAWKGLMASGSLQPNCNKEGFNPYDSCFWNADPQAGVARVRIGIISNQENDCCSADSRIGIGGGGSYCGQDWTNAAGNEAVCSPDNGDRHVEAFGYVYVR